MRLRFVAARDRPPIAGLAFALLREQDGETPLARGTSDAEGRAAVNALEPGIVLVETERRPPFARHVAARSDHDREIRSWLHFAPDSAPSRAQRTETDS